MVWTGQTALRDTARSARDQALVLDFSVLADSSLCKYIMSQATANAAELEEVRFTVEPADNSYLTRSKL
jgi:hypothetical protein